MSRLYFKKALNNLFSKRNNSFISVIGLVIAFTSVFYIYSIVSFESGYDSHHKQRERIYRISGDIIASENTMTHAVLGPLMGPTLQEEFPAIDSFVRLIPVRHTVNLEADRKIFHVEEAYTADASVFSIFTFEFVYGSPEKALQRPNEIVINESLSQKMYGEANPIGKIIIRDGTPLTVAGVIKDCPGNAHHHLDVLFSMGDWWNNQEGINDVRMSEAYWMPSCYTFILLQNDARIEDVINNFKPFYDKYMATFGTHLNAQFAPVAVPLEDLHFSQYMSYDYPKGSRTYTYLFIAIGLFIILIALLNYSNLLVVQNVIQSKSIGIRKINGASQLRIYLLFLFNSLVVITLSLIVAAFLYRLTIPGLIGRLQLSMDPIPNALMFLFVVGLSFVLSSLIALIPFLNQFKQNGLQLIQPKSAANMSKVQLSFGKLSTIAQLSLSIVLLISVMLIGRQLAYMVESDMGFDKENVVLLKLNKTICQPETVKSFKEELLRDSNIESVAFSRYAPGEVLSSFHFQMDRDGKTVTKIINGMAIDYDYIPLMKMELANGRNFSPIHNDRMQSAIVNEATISFCGLIPPVVGQTIADVKIIGILKDVSLNSFHNQAEPLILYLDEQKDGYLNIRMKAEADMPASLSNIEKNWKRFFADEPVEMQFLDKRIEWLYNDDFVKGQLINLLTLISVGLSLMGLFNISVLKSNQRTKEIGIRKVNGAKTSEILLMLNKDFIKWVAIAFVIACPIAYYAMSKWLNNFAYKTELSWWIFALAGLLALFIALLTITWQSLKTARRNPIESLRYE
ncbi:ABC transporter permease [Carboxylicivirga taeanensis]|uniref:ABC transporter permease n=1 Tax=Carboxylicivirga taeanensis TaxID=1416875 RepID=UPI003F6E28A4